MSGASVVAADRAGSCLAEERAVAVRVNVVVEIARAKTITPILDCVAGGDGLAMTFDARSGMVSLLGMQSWQLIGWWIWLDLVLSSQLGIVLSALNSEYSLAI